MNKSKIRKNLNLQKEKESAKKSKAPIEFISQAEIEKSEKKEQKSSQQTYDNIVNPKDLLKKENLKNSDFILLIIELSQNGAKYGFKKSSKSRLFWEDVMKDEKFAKLFSQFKSETLRKYWKVIRDSGKIMTYVKYVNKFSQKIDRQNIK